MNRKITVSGNITANSSNVILNSDINNSTITTTSNDSDIAQLLKEINDSIKENSKITLEKKEACLSTIEKIKKEASKKKPNKAFLEKLLSSLKAIPDIAKAVATLGALLKIGTP